MMSVGYTIPARTILLSTGPVKSKSELLEGARMLLDQGYTLFATKGTHEYYANAGIPTTMLHWPDEEASPNVLEYLKERKIDLVINIPKNLSKTELENDYSIRRNAIDFNIPLITNSRLAAAFIIAFCRIKPDELKIKSWDEY
jgi:carbamoyl-phosphate synthase large subunit